MINRSLNLSNFVILSLILISIFSCDKKTSGKNEQIRVNYPAESGSDSITNFVKGNVSLDQISTSPNSVILTGMAKHRLIPIYKVHDENKNRNEKSYSKYSYYSDDSEIEERFMPGIDILYGYNLLNIAHYNMELEKLNLVFNRPALVKVVYYPSFVQDSINKKPINRDYYLISVYDEDTNKDTLINSRDLRRFYHLNAECVTKTQIIPSDYSVYRSQYDSQNDAMFIYARNDVNKNGLIDKNEPIHIFWIDLKAPKPAKRMY